MIDREQITADLKSDEGFCPHVYQDTEGYYTLGYGFMVDPDRGGEIPIEVADSWLDFNIGQIVDELWGRLDNFHSYPCQVQRALVNMAYQMGVDGLLGFRKMLALIDAGKYREAADEGLKSRWAVQTPNRAQRVTDWIRSAADGMERIHDGE